MYVHLHKILHRNSEVSKFSETTKRDPGHKALSSIYRAQGSLPRGCRYFPYEHMQIGNSLGLLMEILINAMNLGSICMPN